MGRTKEEALDQLSFIAITTVFVATFFVVGVGLLTTKIKLWKLLSVCYLLAMASFLVVCGDYWAHDKKRITGLYTFGIISSLVWVNCLGALGYIIMSKLSSPEARGTIFFTAGLLSSVGILVLQAVGGKLYDAGNKEGAFIIGIAFSVVGLVVIVVLRCLGKFEV